MTQPAAGTNAIEYYNVDLDHYFLTSFADETQFVESGGAGRGWVRTGYSFGVGAGAASPAGVGAAALSSLANVCRFYGNPQINPATGQRRGPNSHFYTAEADECAQVKLDAGWIFETGNRVCNSGSAGRFMPGQYDSGIQALQQRLRHQQFEPPVHDQFACLPVHADPAMVRRTDRHVRSRACCLKRPLDPCGRTDRKSPAGSGGHDGVHPERHAAQPGIVAVAGEGAQRFGSDLR